jgi:hypothetical protein
MTKLTERVISHFFPYKAMSTKNNFFLKDNQMLLLWVVAQIAFLPLLSLRSKVFQNSRFDEYHKSKPNQN